MDPKIAIEASGKFMAELLKRNNGDVAKMFERYNGSGKDARNYSSTRMNVMAALNGDGGISIKKSAKMAGVNEALQQAIIAAAKSSEYAVEVKSGFRHGDKREHGKGNAMDVNLIDKKTGKALADYQDPKHFRAYEQFAQSVKENYDKNNPNNKDSLRWGGYFSGKKNYGALDLMHFDTAGDRIGMAGGSWDKGLTDKQKILWPGIQSQGMNRPSIMTAAGNTTKNVSSTSEVKINTITINSKATDANGIAKDIRQSIKQNPIIQANGAMA